MYNVYHGSWRDFGTAVGAIVCTEMNTIFGATFVGHWFVDAFCSLRSHGTRDKAGSIIDKGYRERVSVEVFCSLRSHGHGKGRGRAITYEQLFICRVCSNKLTTANLCDRKKTPLWAREIL